MYVTAWPWATRAFTILATYSVIQEHISMCLPVLLFCEDVPQTYCITFPLMQHSHS